MATQREKRKAMIKVLSEESGFICNVNQKNSFGDFCNYCNASVTPSICKASIKLLTKAWEEAPQKDWLGEIKTTMARALLKDKHCTPAVNILCRRPDLTHFFKILSVQISSCYLCHCVFCFKTLVTLTVIQTLWWTPLIKLKPLYWHWACLSPYITRNYITPTWL